MIPPETFEARLAEARRLSPNVRELVFRRRGGAPFAFLPGQWVNLMLPLPSGELKRSYSIASAPDASGRFEIAVTRVVGGPGSEYLHFLPEGSVLRVVGPHGLFTRTPDEATPALFVATGTGIAPLRSMIHAAISGGSRAPMWLLFGARHEEDTLYQNELEALARSNPNVRYDVTLSQASSSWAGRRGYVQAHVPELLQSIRASVAPAEPHIYICGLDRMVSAVRDLARKELGVDRKRIHQERYD